VGAVTLFWGGVVDMMDDSTLIYMRFEPNAKSVASAFGSYSVSNAFRESRAGHLYIDPDTRPIRVLGSSSLLTVRSRIGGCRWSTAYNTSAGAEYLRAVMRRPSVAQILFGTSQDDRPAPLSPPTWPVSEVNQAFVRLLERDDD